MDMGNKGMIHPTPTLIFSNKLIGVIFCKHEAPFDTELRSAIVVAHIPFCRLFQA
jgi:hypothetical protein